MQRVTSAIRGEALPGRIDTAKLDAEVNAAVLSYIESVRSKPLGEGETIEAPDFLGEGLIVDSDPAELVGIATERNDEGETRSVRFTYAQKVWIGGDEIDIPESVIADAIKAHTVSVEEDTDVERQVKLASQKVEREARKLEVEQLLADEQMLDLLQGLEKELDELKERVAALESPKLVVGKG